MVSVHLIARLFHRSLLTDRSPRSLGVGLLAWGVLTFCSAILPGDGQLDAQEDFLRGDFDGNGLVEPLVDYAYMAGTFDLQTMTFATNCQDAADWNDDGVVDLNDGVGLLRIWWDDGLDPALAPGVLVCGPDPTPDSLTCLSNNCGIPPTPPPLPGGLLTIESRSAAVLDEIAVELSFDHGVDLRGFSFAVCHDPSMLEVLSIDIGTDLPISPANIQYGAFHHIDASGLGWDFVYSTGLIGNAVLPAGSRVIVRPVYRCLATGQTTIDFCTTIGPLPLPPRAVQTDTTVFEIQTVAGVIDITPPPLLGDDCGSPTLIELGTHFLTTLGATTDGPDLTGSCGFSGSIENDVWVEISAECTGTLELTLESDEFAPRFAVYSGASCPAVVASLIDCADGATTPDPDQAFLQLAVQAGDTLLIQVGTDGAGVGLGSLTYNCTPTPTYILADEFSAPTPNASGNFGQAIALSGNTLAISEMGDNSGEGSVHLYEKNGQLWTLVETLMASTTASSPQFGVSLAIDGNTLVVGQMSPEEVVVFRRQGGVWSETQVLAAPSAAIPEGFGGTLSLSGAVLAIGGASLDRVIMYRDVGGAWVEEQTIVSPDPSDQQFGWEVEVQGNRLLVSDVFYDQGQGRGYIYEYDGQSWTLIDRLIPSDGQSLDLFGAGIALSGDRAFLGAPGHDAACPATQPCDSGAVYVFELSGGVWSEAAKVEAELPTALERLGSRVNALPNGDFIADSAGGVGVPGAVHFFEPSGGTWTSMQVITPSSPNDASGFGFATAWNSTDLIIGANLDDFSAADAGRVSVFERTGGLLVNTFSRADCNQDASLNIADAIFLLSHLFPPVGGSPSPTCDDACDANDDGGLNLADAITILGSLFASPPVAIPPPSLCGLDSVADALDCAVTGGACP